ncbi:MAG TPA: cysteine--tRNA ligase [Clostridiales bacterium]|nr:cysteine--tRNA ligase [Clostridiales bacterium]
MKVYNTLDREKEEFTPIQGNLVRMYSCGPTVYSYAHIGNMRTYIFMDLLRRSLRFCGFKVKGVMNITDVGHLLSDGDEGEDKMQKAARKEGKTPWEIAAFYTDAFFKDIDALNVGRPEIIAKATDHIPEMIEFVKGLLEKGYAYEISDGIYFDIGKFPGYGKLSGQTVDEKEAGARIEENSEKRHPADFALWKKADKNHIMQWESPWGMGFPGWHIECSAMSKKYLGEVFDLHTGGIDAVPVHHENEIAQNEALAGKKTVNYWMHGEFMMVDGGKMSKSLGNVYTVSDLEKKGYLPLDFRYFCLNAHYRKKLNFTFEGMDAAHVSYERLRNALYAHKMSQTATDPAVIEELMKKFKGAVEDDMNIPYALGVLWDAVKLPKSKDVYKLALEFDKVLGLSLDKVTAPAPEKIDVPADIAALAEARLAAKKEKNWAEADRLRAEIAAKGYAIKDTKDGYEIERK